MPLITREDGEKFAVYTYRERLNAKNQALFKREALILSRENGQYALFMLQPAHEIEVILSRDPGYLLGELIAQHFDNPYDLIYCEALPDGEYAILVVVRGGSVYLDAHLPIINLADELISLVSGDSEYQIYVYGDVPLAESATDEKFAFDKSMVASFTTLETPVFPTLEVDDAFKLLPIDDALDVLKLPVSNTLKIAIFLVVFILIGGGAWKLLAPKPVQPELGTLNTPQVQAPSNNNSVNPYAVYQTTLASISPADIINMAAEKVQLLFTLPGWVPSTMAFMPTDNTLSVTLKSTGGDLSLLLAWIKKNRVDLDASAGTPVLIFPLNIPVRPVFTVMYNNRDMIAALYDILYRLMPDSKPIIGPTVKVSNFKQTPFSINFTNISPNMLILISKELQAYPAVLTQFSLTVDNGFLSGTIAMQILGA